MDADTYIEGVTVGGSYFAIGISQRPHLLSTYVSQESYFSVLFFHR